MDGCRLVKEKEVDRGCFIGGFVTGWVNGGASRGMVVGAVGVAGEFSVELGLKLKDDDGSSMREMMKQKKVGTGSHHGAVVGW
ncbi:hypothetical protein V6N13_083169 [Hibiscus sabdariffa]